LAILLAQVVLPAQLGPMIAMFIIQEWRQKEPPKGVN